MFEKFIQKIKKKKNLENVTIFPLSSNPALSSLEDQANRKNLYIYYEYLDYAFRESRIRNMAITGGFGIGKSSIIRSFENDRKRKKFDQNCKGFLYVSLGQFANEISQGENRKDQKGQKGVEQEEGESESLNALERRMLLQIYARFHRHDLPSSSFKLIRENVSLRVLKSVMVALLIGMLLLLIYHEPLGKLLVAVYQYLWIVKFKLYLHLALYIVVILSFSVLIGIFSYQLLPRLRLSSLSVKADKAEVALEKEACESYLDQYSMELVYCLEQVAKKIRRTVVFEDMDRLETETCIKILTRLREINYLVNLRLKQSKYIRFIYVVNDNIIGKFSYIKFFDYILPVIPSLNKKTAEMIFLKNLEKVNEGLINEKDVKCFEWVERIDEESLLHRISLYLDDFRLQYTVLNEYQLLWKLYLENNSENIKENDAEQVLALTVYKNFWPDDYNKIITNESKVLPYCNIDELSDWKNYELLKILVDSKQCFLNAHCLYYTGYGAQEIADKQRSILENNHTGSSIGVIDSVQKDDVESIEMICQYYGNLNINEGMDLEKYKKIFKSVIKCMIRCKHIGNDWFFKERYIMDCIDILADMEDDKITDFFIISGLSEKGDVFEKCTSRHQLENIPVWTERQVIVFCMGVKKLNSAVNIKVEKNNKIEVVSLNQEVDNYWKQRT